MLAQSAVPKISAIGPAELLRLAVTITLLALVRTKRCMPDTKFKAARQGVSRSYRDRKRLSNQ